MGILLVILGLVALAVGIGSLVCWIMVVITAFQKEESPLMGILCIVLCGLGAFIIGWVKNADWGINQLMIIWSCLIGGSIVLQVIAGIVGAAVGAAQGQNF